MKAYRHTAIAILGALALLAAPHALAALAPVKKATTIYHATLTETAYCSDGSDRARDGKPRFDGAMEAPLLSYKGHQYISYYEASGELVVARRPLDPNAPWQKAAVSGFTMTSQDRHNKIAIGISEADGRIHLAFDHHNTPQIKYAVSPKGIADQPNSFPWDDDTFALTPNLGLDIKPDLVTYPEFASLHGTGNLVVYWRSGGAVGGEMNIAHYDSAQSQWSFIGRFTSRDGSYKGARGSRGPYAAGIMSDASGALQLAWLWREHPSQRGGAFRYGNHGLFFAQSQDGGFSWLDSWGKPLADTRQGQVISIDNIGKPAYEIPMEIEPSNANMAAAIDPQTGHYHATLVHQLPDSKTRKTHHYARNRSGDWALLSSSLPSGSGTTLAFQDDLLFALIGTDVLYATRKDDFGKWTKIAMPNDVAAGHYRWDTGRLPEGIVSLSVQLKPDTLGQPTPVKVYEFQVATPKK